MSIATENESISRGIRFWAPRAASAVLVPILLLAALEGALRLFAVGFPTDVTVTCTLQGRPAYCYN
jgi:hypothetical protein